MVYIDTEGGSQSDVSSGPVMQYIPVLQEYSNDEDFMGMYNNICTYIISIATYILYILV